LTITGVVDGTLKDANGYIYEKVRRGRIADYFNFSNIRVKLYDYNNECIIEGLYTETATKSIDAMDIHKALTNLPISTLKEFDSIQFINNDSNLSFMVCGIKNNNQSFYLYYRNITNTAQDINNSCFRFIIKGQIEFSNTSIVWD